MDWEKRGLRDGRVGKDSRTVEEVYYQSRQDADDYYRGWMMGCRETNPPGKMQYYERRDI
jgi:hypothetical protein